MLGPDFIARPWAGVSEGQRDTPTVCRPNKVTAIFAVAKDGFMQKAIVGGQTFARCRFDLVALESYRMACWIHVGHDGCWGGRTVIRAPVRVD